MHVVLSTDDTDTLVGQVTYPSLNCEGRWEPTETALTFVETIDVGRSRCVSGGTFVLTPGDGDLSWTWYYPDGELGATGELSRTDEPAPAITPPTSQPM